MIRTVLACAAAFALTGCGAAPEKSAPAPEAAAPRVKDHTSMMPLDGRIATEVVRDHVLGMAKLPGGTVGDYDLKGKKYQLFIVDTDTDQQAAFLLMDAKGALATPEYISYMGGYFGDLTGDTGKQPVYVFSKLHYLAGVAGLSKEQADPIARTLAARLK